VKVDLIKHQVNIEIDLLKKIWGIDFYNRLFEEMRLGLHEEGSLSLRLKIDYAHDNPTLRDPHVYRIRYTGHPHCGSKWCIYPLYDFTHCT